MDLELNGKVAVVTGAGRGIGRAITDALLHAIVNVASVDAFFQPDSGTIDYGPAKAAVVNLSKSLAQELGARGIRVNCVSPGPVETVTQL
jgi:NAD(P)-dependent dehydrogenase (short-subunit alcohol dehydrogenase family)